MSGNLQESLQVGGTVPDRHTTGLELASATFSSCPQRGFLRSDLEPKHTSRNATCGAIVEWPMDRGQREADEPWQSNHHQVSLFDCSRSYLLMEYFFSGSA